MALGLNLLLIILTLGLQLELADWQRISAHRVVLVIFLILFVAAALVISAWYLEILAADAGHSLWLVSTSAVLLPTLFCTGKESLIFPFLWMVLIGSAVCARAFPKQRGQLRKYLIVLVPWGLKIIGMLTLVFTVYLLYESGKAAGRTLEETGIHSVKILAEMLSKAGYMGGI